MAPGGRAGSKVLAISVAGWRGAENEVAVRPCLISAEQVEAAKKAGQFAPVLGEVIADAIEDKPSRFTARFGWRTKATRKAEDARWGMS